MPKEVIQKIFICPISLHKKIKIYKLVTIVKRKVIKKTIGLKKKNQNKLHPS